MLHRAMKKSSIRLIAKTNLPLERTLITKRLKKTAQIIDADNVVEDDLMLTTATLSTVQVSLQIWFHWTRMLVPLLQILQFTTNLRITNPFLLPIRNRVQPIIDWLFTKMLTMATKEGKILMKNFAKVKWTHERWLLRSQLMMIVLRMKKRIKKKSW